MCYAKPGPRCSKHAYEELQEAKKALDKVLPYRSMELFITPATDIKLAVRRYSKALVNYNETPQGIKETRAKAQALIEAGKIDEGITLNQEADYNADNRLIKINRYKMTEKLKAKLAFVPEVIQLITGWFDAAKASDPDATETELDEFSKHESWSVREVSAAHERTSTKALTRLTKDKNARVRAVAALNPNTPIADVERLAKDPDARVRAAVAFNNAVSPELLNSLRSDEDIRVKRSVALSPNATPETLSQLANESDTEVTRCVAMNGNTPANVLTKYIKHPDPMIRGHLASNENASAETLRFLAVDKSSFVRASVARNRRTSDQIMFALANDKSNEVRSFAKDVMEYRLESAAS